jgi:hypothetical protein
MIDRKFKFLAVNPSNGKVYTENEGVVFLVKDNLFLPMLKEYHLLVCATSIEGADSDEAKSILLMIERAYAWRQNHPDQLKLPDITGEIERQRLLMPNESILDHPV